MSQPGAFIGVLATGSWSGPPTNRNYISPEVCLPLGPAVPVHAGHDLLRTPVAVAVPWYVPDYFDDGGGAIRHRCRARQPRSKGMGPGRRQRGRTFTDLDGPAAGRAGRQALRGERCG